ncbi:MAG: SHOCT domain-containing protein [Acidobacteriaceae bacterium]
MHRQSRFAGIAGVLALACAGCAGPAGPGFGWGPGLGPEWDQFTGLLLLACVGVGLYWLLRRSSLVEIRRSRPGTESAVMQEAERIVRQRYARGEIEREEFLEKLNDLGKRIA